MSNDNGARLLGCFRGGVSGSVINDCHGVTATSDIGDDPRDHARLVIGGDHDPYAPARFGLHGLSNGG
jgi:hypothetical protein